MLSVMLLIDIPMDINSKFEVSVRSVICVIGTTAIVVSGAAWLIAKLSLQKELQAYKAANDWKSGGGPS